MVSINLILNFHIERSSNWGDNGEMNNVQFNNCLIGRAFISSFNNNVVFLNCVINNLLNGTSGYGSNAPSVLVFNSIVIAGDYTAWNDLFLYNSIVGYAYRINGTYAGNCIQVGSVFPSTVQAVGCMAVDSYSDVFENWDGTFAYDADFSLKEEIASGFLGTDGSEVGIYGGMMPYNPRPSYLISYRCQVAGHTTIDGQLSVDVEVVTGD